MKIKQREFVLFLFSVITVSLVLNLGQVYSFWDIEPQFLLVSRWLAMSALIWYALRKKSLTTWILISMILGAEFGHDVPSVAIHLNILSKIFLNMVKTIIAPLLFGTLVVGIAGHSNLRQIGRMGWKSIVYFELVSTIALFIGLLAINISKAGVGIIIPNTISQTGIPLVKTQTWEEVILHIFPENIAKAISEGQVLQIVVFSIVFGIAVAMLNDLHRKRMVHFAESISETMFKFTKLIMYFAPVAVFAAIAFSVGNMGIGILGNLLKLLATLYVSLLVFLLAVLLPIALIVKIPIRNFVRAVAEPATIAFATSSSESALPIAMEAMEKYGVPRKVVAFVMPTGYSFNLDGTTLYLSLATIFVAQCAGIYLSLDKQLLMVFTLMLTSKGVAGVSRAALVILLGTVASFGLPAWPVFIILGIDGLMDMARTSVNVVGNCLATAVVARWEGEFDDNAAKNFTAKMIG